MVGVFDSFSCIPDEFEFPPECSDWYGISQSDCLQNCKDNIFPKTCTNDTAKSMNCQYTLYEPNNRYCKLQADCHEDNHTMFFKKIEGN